MIEDAIHDLLRRGCNMILCTGGMSVDPDDRTPLAIKNVTGNVVSYGAPGASGSDVLAGILRRRSACDGIAWLCHVCQENRV